MQTALGGAANLFSSCAGPKMTRDALRQAYRSKRDAHAAKKSQPDRWPADVVSIFASATCVGGYWPMGSELSPLSLLKELASQGIPTALPAFVDRASPMTFRMWTPGQRLENAPWPFEQPSADSPSALPDILIIPLIAFDQNCNRLGQGGGHYDHYLFQQFNVLKVGFGWSLQECDNLPVAEWDVPMDMVVTEHGIVHRRAERDLT
jgi:5-formyltetrahydrofolate cyclo-ligase